MAACVTTTTVNGIEVKLYCNEQGRRGTEARRMSRWVRVLRPLSEAEVEKIRKTHREIVAKKKALARMIEALTMDPAAAVAAAMAKATEAE